VDALTDALVEGGTAPATARLATKVAMAAFEHASRQWAGDAAIDLRAAIAQAVDEVLTLSRD
jgi:hypothetical protein